MISKVIVTFVDLFVPLFSAVLLMRVILSYLMQPGSRLMEALFSLTEPALAPVRRIFPPAGGVDFAPLVVLFLLQGAQMVIDGLVR